MLVTASSHVRRVFQRAAREPLIPLPDQVGAPVLDRVAIEALLPHRDPFLFIDQVTAFDLKAQIITARCALSETSPILAGHFPKHPLWPGVLQVEAIAQAGLIVSHMQTRTIATGQETLTHILGARFIRPVKPIAEMEVIAHIIEDGLFLTIVGQCLQNGQICSVAALNTLL
jgi:3-hydroxyacyl-[acyl-carrier-protein] dehydratase